MLGNMFLAEARKHLNLSDNIVEGWKSLVNLVEEWTVLEEYANDKQGFYQLLEGSSGLEVRVLVGRLGFKREFKDKGDPLLNRILNFCINKSYIKVGENIRDELFFK